MSSRMTLFKVDTTSGFGRIGARLKCSLLQPERLTARRANTVMWQPADVPMEQRSSKGCNDGSCHRVASCRNRVRFPKVHGSTNFSQRQQS